MEEKKEVLAEIHKVQLKMLKAVVALFEKYDLRYSLYCGTLLGAVRHKGFIPWDDDIDLAMPLEDYRRFLEHADELPSDFVCEHRGNNDECDYLWAKILANGTTFMNLDSAKLEKHHGLFLDIYPMIGTPESSFLQNAQRKLLYIAVRLQRATYYRYMKNSGCARWIIAHCPDIFRKAVIDFIMWLCEIDTSHSEYIGTIDSAPFEGKFNREAWIEMTKLPFEGAYYTAPVQYDKILRRMYGDYMKLPPEEKRIGHSDENMIIDLHRDYRLYRKELLRK